MKGNGSMIIEVNVSLKFYQTEYEKGLEEFKKLMDNGYTMVDDTDYINGYRIMTFQLVHNE
jgi:hypothetical protein